MVFFPALGAAAGTVASFGTFAVAFIARPVGAIIFGHYGDRIGRKKTLITTLLMMGIATVMIGLIPDASTIGVAAPILLVVLRFVQGLVFITIGWRVPFILSAVLVLVGLWVRTSIEETPVFKNAKRPEAATKLPIVESIKRQPNEILLAGGSLTLLFAFFYIGTAFLTSYATSPSGMKLSRPEVLTMGIIASVFVAAATLASGILSDRFGRKKVIASSCIIAVPWSLVLFPLLGMGTVLAFGASLTVTLVIFAIAYGPAGALLPELFETKYRYTGAGMGYNLAGVMGGGIVPLVAAQLITSTGGWGIGVLLAVIGVFSIACTIALPNREKTGLEDVPRPLEP